MLKEVFAEEGKQIDWWNLVTPGKQKARNTQFYGLFNK
jgi:hypothetical protein